MPRIAYENETTLYLNTAAVALTTTKTEREAANTFVKTLKDASMWTIMDRIYLVSPTSAAAALVDLKGRTSATNVNSVTWGASGWTTNGTTNYIRTDLAPSASSNITTDSAHASVYMDGFFNVDGGVVVGCRHSVTTFEFSLYGGLGA